MDGRESINDNLFETKNPKDLSSKIYDMTDEQTQAAPLMAIVINRVITLVIQGQRVSTKAFIPNKAAIQVVHT